MSPQSYNFRPKQIGIGERRSSESGGEAVVEVDLVEAGEAIGVGVEAGSVVPEIIGTAVGTIL